MFRLYARLKAIKRILKDKTSICYEVIHQKVAQAKERSEQAQREILINYGYCVCYENEKAPGPDGFPIEFFKKAWSIVGRDVIVAIRNFFQYGKLLKAANATIITLVLKKVNPSKMGDFRPISCCNLIYKCITKILANQLVFCLEDLISPNQITFIPNRSIVENVLLAQEVMKNYHKSGGSARYTMKVDLMKVYDSVNWDFALHSLCCFVLVDNACGCSFDSKITEIYYIYKTLTHDSQQRSANEARGGKFKLNANSKMAIEMSKMANQMQSLQTFIQNIGNHRVGVKQTGEQNASGSGVFNRMMEGQDQDEVQAMGF
ncbi:hypothetical protein LWI29_023662 [Acer saccharum]|uniref:Reverse transcriptase domain-containing protein n=1 Tax=Acer saccharum TaxID=4024 RepID=A0AA39W304_ACESA|nr:hypothetical protein LWI29_023662 [Acer saccharum]